MRTRKVVFSRSVLVVTEDRYMFCTTSDNAPFPARVRQLCGSCFRSFPAERTRVIVGSGNRTSSSERFSTISRVFKFSIRTLPACCCGKILANKGFREGANPELLTWRSECPSVYRRFVNLDMDAHGDPKLSAFSHEAENRSRRANAHCAGILKKRPLSTPPMSGVLDSPLE